MEKILCILFLLSNFFLQAQEGFNKLYSIGSGGNHFGSILYVEDTLFTVGVSFSEAPHVQELFFAKMDTLGGILSIKYYRDSLDRDLIFGTRPNGFLKLSDNSGFIFRGTIFQNNNGVVSKINNDGNLIFRREIELQDAAGISIRDILELPDGYLLFGNKVFADLHSGIFVTKINQEGHIVWETDFSSGSNRRLFYGSVCVKGENEYVIGGNTTSSSITPTQFIKNTGKIFAIDSLGNKKWEWESEQTTEQAGVGTLHLTDEGDWIFNSVKGTYNSTFNAFDKEPSIVIRDTATFEILDERVVYTPIPGTISYFSNLISLNDGAYLAIGTMLGHLPIEPNYDVNAQLGVMYKINYELDSIWSWRDTAAWNFLGGSRNYPLNAVELESGSIVVCGYHQDPETSATKGWLYKVDKNGCMDTLNCVLPVSIEEVPLPKPSISTYPNPATQIVNFVISDEAQFSGQSIFIHNLDGKIITKIPYSTSPFWDVELVESGIYFYSIRDNNGSHHSGKIIIK
ncbi:MAG: hypothetical protein ACI9LN_002851 [Saprospiraceae bacterium]|jgi:hypothetical protein